MCKMLLFILFGLLVSATSFTQTNAEIAKPNLMCYFEGASFYREGLAKLNINDLDPALKICTHLIYGYGDIGVPQAGLVSNLVKLDMDFGNGMWRTVTGIKRKHPHLKVLLSVGGDKCADCADKYNVVAHEPSAQAIFVNSAFTVLRKYHFDGIDLAWQFPKNRPAQVHHSVSNIWNSETTEYAANKTIEKKRGQFTRFIKLFRDALRPVGLIVGLSVMPQVNSSVYFNVADIIGNLDYVTLHAYDFQTPEQNPDLADFSAPIYALNDRNPEFNVHFQVQYWLNHSTPASKINLGIASYGRSWEMTNKSGRTGIPPVIATDGDGPSGYYTRQPGLLSYTEVCSMFANSRQHELIDAGGPWHKVSDPAKRAGTYAYCLAEVGGRSGAWVSYEDTVTAAQKAAFVKQLGLGGAALMDLSNDDFSGYCSKTEYPILHAIKHALFS